MVENLTIGLVAVAFLAMMVVVFLGGIGVLP